MYISGCIIKYVGKPCDFSIYVYQVLLLHNKDIRDILYYIKMYGMWGFQKDTFYPICECYFSM